MPEKPLPFVITDRRKFTTEGEPRPDADPTPERTRESVPASTRESVPAGTPVSVLEPVSQREPALTRKPEPNTASPIRQVPQSISAPEPPVAASLTDPLGQPADDLDADLPPAPTAEQMEQSRLAYQATAERLETAIRAANPGADHPPALTFESLVQSVYMQAILQLGGGTQEGQQPQVDLLGAKQSIDMLTVLSDRTAANLSPSEDTMLASALFELRLAFLEITQALARSAQQRASGPGVPPPPGTRPGPSIVR